MDSIIGFIRLTLLDGRALRLSYSEVEGWLDEDGGWEGSIVRTTTGKEFQVRESGDEILSFFMAITEHFG